MTDRTAFVTPGRFIVGCNYWAAHAGTAMWRDWRPEVIDRDLKVLAEAGLQIIRVFPLWPDFQPIHLLRSCQGHPAEYRFGEQPLGDDEAGQAGVSAEAIERFAEFIAIAERHGLKLSVGLVTGWMSGRLFVPPALEGLDVLTDPRAILWQVRLVRYFVRRFRDEREVIAWGLGNECNCMGTATREQAWVWAATIADATRSADPSRPVISGMHSLFAGPEGSWTIGDQAELTDVLTTHPYPLFTPGCDLDPLNTMRSCLHATAETRLYGDVGGRPCLVEEFGTLGPNVGSDAVAADYLRTNLFSLWANDGRALLWWCANEQSHLEAAPYDWDSIERELGLLRCDHSAKPVLGELGRFRRLIEAMPFEALPPRLTDAVCILTRGQDTWRNGYAAFILAKQAGFDFEFQFADQPIREAPLYLLPGLCGQQWMRRRRWLELLARVEAGATLYMSYDSAIISSFEEVTGLESQTRCVRPGAVKATFDALPGEPNFEIPTGVKLTVKPTRAQVLAREDDGNPVFAVCAYGNGKVYFLGWPLERQLAHQPGAFCEPDVPAWWRIYRHVADSVPSQRVVGKTNPFVGVTEHPLDQKTRVIVAVNYSPDEVESGITISDGWQVKSLLHGKPERLDRNDAAVFLIARR